MELEYIRVLMRKNYLYRQANKLLALVEDGEESLRETFIETRQKLIEYERMLVRMENDFYNSN
jgi:hypothetical protein